LHEIFLRARNTLKLVAKAVGGEAEAAASSPFVAKRVIPRGRPS
jgi:hypothetical protein